jgi:IstB-like ATP binding protein
LRGQPVLFATCTLLVQELLTAKRDLKLERFLKKLAGFAALVIDDLGYVQQSREEMEVLFTLLPGGTLRAGQRDADQQPAVLRLPNKLPPRDSPIRPASIRLRSAFLRCWNSQNGAGNGARILTEVNHANRE